MSEIIRLEPKAANNCFGCGGANESGMHLTFDLYVDEGKTRGTFVLGSWYGGGAGIPTSGVKALPFDDADGKNSKLTRANFCTPGYCGADPHAPPSCGT